VTIEIWIKETREIEGAMLITKPITLAEKEAMALTSLSGDGNKRWGEDGG